MSNDNRSPTPRMMAFPDDGFVALHTPDEMVPAERPPNADGYLIRFKSAEGFKAFMVAALEAASMVWPEIAQEWID